MPSFTGYDKIYQVDLSWDNTSIEYFAIECTLWQEFNDKLSKAVSAEMRRRNTSQPPTVMCVRLIDTVELQRQRQELAEAQRRQLYGQKRTLVATQKS